MRQFEAGDIIISPSGDLVFYVESIKLLGAAYYSIRYNLRVLQSLNGGMIKGAQIKGVLPQSIDLYTLATPIFIER